MLRYVSKGGLVWLWSIIPIVVLLETAIQWQIGQRVPTSKEWTAAAQAVRAEKKHGDLVVIAPHWATQGRMYLKDLLPLKDFGRFDTSRYDRIFEISVNQARAPETNGLDAQRVQRFGRLSLTQYQTNGRAHVTYDFVDAAPSARVTNGTPIRPRIVIDHWFFPRLVMPIALRRDGVTITFSNVPLRSDIIRGYGIVGYRSGRFNKGGPITLSVVVNDQPIGQHRIENFGPREPFEFQLPQGVDVGEVRFEIRAASGLNREFGFAADIRKARQGRN
ncbi:MAG: hypothetical protein QNJ97_08250 [Myxococcota bacterium]|nr:hypothetical protein [Myxococcota bacterium]